jgi:hypothetical protein
MKSSGKPHHLIFHAKYRGASLLKLLVQQALLSYPAQGGGTQRDFSLAWLEEV